jgi:hypothetical protein
VEIGSEFLRAVEWGRWEETMNTIKSALLKMIPVIFFIFTACGSDSGGGDLSTATESTSKWTGKYKLTNIMAYDRQYYETYRYTIGSGSCGFTLSDNSNGWYRLQETNDCSIKDEYGDTYPLVSSSRMNIKIDSYGSLSDVEEDSIGTSSSNTSSSTILEIDLTFGTSTAVLKTVVELEQGAIVDYTYTYSKQ